MTEFLQFVVLGLGLGALYGLISQGLIVIYRGSGILNFAQGAIGIVGAYVAYEIHGRANHPFAIAIIVGVLASVVVGALTHLLVMRPLRHASTLSRIVATLGVLVTLQAIAALRYGTNVIVVESSLPATHWTIAGVAVLTDRVILLSLAIVLCVALSLVYKRTRFGLATTAAAGNQRAASALGISPDRVATLNWALGSGLAGLAAILISPIATLQISTQTSLVLAGIAAALIAGFTSFPRALAGGLVIGVIEAELGRYAGNVPGLADSVPFFIILAVMVARGRSLPLRDFFLQRLPTVGTGTVRLRYLIPAVAFCACLCGFTGINWIAALTITFAMGLVIMSVVVLTGYAGQVSLGQYALAGFGAWITGRLVATTGIPFIVCVVLGVLGTVVVGLLFALPAVRIRGVNLAVVSLGLASAVYEMIFNNGNLTGGYGGTTVGSPKLFGWAVGSIDHPSRYAFLTLACFTSAGLMVANIRRGRSGRRLLAVRTNERAAAALGINVAAAKLYAFGVAAAIAALGGILLAFTNTTIVYASFDVFTSIYVVGWAIIGGVGYLLGPLVGATLAPGALGTQITNTVFPGLTKYIELIGGVSIILLLIANQNGIVAENIKVFRRLSSSAIALRVVGWLSATPLGRLGAVRSKKGGEPSHLVHRGPETGGRVPAQTLEVKKLMVAYGSTVAVNDVSFTVRPGQILGLIGPNGAGKTSVIDAVTGFAPIRSGTIMLNGRRIESESAVARARLGITRSFQALELFEDSTVLDNLLAAADPRDIRSYFVDLVHPITPPLTDAVKLAIDEFGLGSTLGIRVDELSYSRRRLVAIARTVAASPSVLLLDEPAAGLSENESRDLAVLVRRLAETWGMAILLVEHDINFVMSICDEITVLDYGNRIAHGAPGVVRADPIVIAAYLGEDDQAAPQTLEADSMAS